MESVRLKAENILLPGLLLEEYINYKSKSMLNCSNEGRTITQSALSIKTKNLG